MIDVLIVEDDHALGGSLRDYLQGEGFKVRWERLLFEGRRAVAERRPQVLVLDWMLPDGQALDWVQALRRGADPLRVIMLTARAELVDRVLGLESGANDYLTKPVEPRELAARIRVQARDTQEPRGAQELRARDIRLDLTTREATRGDRPVSLTRMELELLRVFMESPRKAFSREELLNQVWGFDHFPSTRTVDTHVLQLRQKLGAAAFETIRGVGYRFNDKD